MTSEELKNRENTIDNFQEKLDSMDSTMEVLQEVLAGSVMEPLQNVLDCWDEKVKRIFDELVTEVQEPAPIMKSRSLIDIRMINKINKEYSDCHIYGMRTSTLTESDIEGYQKQSTALKEFDYELVDQHSIGDSGDSFEGTIALPLGGNEFVMFQVSM